MSSYYPKQEQFDKGNATEETRDFFPQDRRLRMAGFKIHSRVKENEPQWGRGDQVYGEREALAIVRAEEKRAKEQTVQITAGQAPAG